MAEPASRVQVITNRQAHAIADEFYRELMAACSDDPDIEQEADAVLLARATTWTPRSSAMADVQARIGDQVLPAIKDFLDRRGILSDASGYAKVRDAVHAAMMQGHETLLRHADGDYRPDQDADRFPPPVAIEPTLAPAPALTSKELFDAYQDEAKTAASTQKKWRGIFAALVRFVGHDDMRSITENDVLRWKTALLAGGSSNRHVKYSYLAALGAVFNYAVANKLMTTNPASGVKVKATKQVSTRQKGFTEVEALTILRATLASVSPRTTVEFAAARRWVPWLCAYSGARVNDITQLRAADILTIESGGETISILRISPEAGSVKSGEYRDVVLHPDLIAQGFLNYVATRAGRHLFYDPSRRRGGKDGNPQYKKVGEKLAKWVRQIGVDDPAVQPNHGWRHRFNRLCRAVKIEADVRDHITGHAPRTVGEGYGDLWLHVQAREIARIPAYKI